MSYTPARLHRRNFLKGAGLSIAGASSLALPAAPASAAPLPLVRPIWSHRAYSAFGVCALPNHRNTPYRFTERWMAALDRTGASYFRGMYSHRIDATRRTIRAARSRGIKWGMTVCPDLSFPDDMLVARIKHIAANAADLCLYVEGINEPNYIRGQGGVPAGWVARAAAKQRLIWETVKGDPRLSHVPVLGPSLQAVVGDESHYRALAGAGTLRYMDYAALHRYHGGRYPDHKLDERIAWIDRFWGGKPAWITETGYTNALASRRGHRPVPEDVSASYAPSALLEAVDRGANVSWFELLDSPDPGAKDDIEDNFGMYAVRGGAAPPWRPKPVVRSIRSFLTSLKDPGPDYDPPAVRLRVTSPSDDVRSTVTAKRNGSVTVHLRRATNCWDPQRQRRIAVPKVGVRVQTPSGTRTVAVDHRVQSVTL